MSVFNNPEQSAKGLGLGLGLRHPHMAQILAGEANVDWFEVISENYMDSGGRSLYDLHRVAEQYPVVFHGVSMSIGSTDPLNFEYLTKLKSLAKKVPPQWISDHLCWTGIQGLNSHDLLPVPLNETSLQHITTRINTVQDFLGRQLILENPSSYLRFVDSTISEPDFLRALCEQTHCGLLLDVNNVYVTAFNTGEDPKEYLARFPFEHVIQMHVAGHEDCVSHIIDTHDRPVREEVWQLFKIVANQTQGVASCLEWDGNIPSLAVCEAEIFKAKQYINQLDDVNFISADFQAYRGALSTPIEHLIPQVMNSIISDDIEY